MSCAEEIVLRTCAFPPFSSALTPQDPPTAHSIELLRDEVERYLREFKERVCSDLTSLKECLVEIENRVDACCGSG